MERQLLEEHIFAIDRENTGSNVLLTDAKVIAFLLDNCEITIPEESRFFVRVNCEKLKEKLDVARRKAIPVEALIAEYKMANANKAYKGLRDFGHTAPNWDAVMALGIPGLKKRAVDRTTPAWNPDFVESQQIVWDAAERFCLRCAEKADACDKKEMADGLRHLVVGTPRNLYEAMQLTLVFYTLQQYAEYTILRTLGRLDRMFDPFYKKETDREATKKLFSDYILEIDHLRVSANMPFALGGSDISGKDQINETSYMLLNAYAEIKPSDTKLHILCTPNMPRDFLARAMESIRNGGNSIVFINDEVIIEGLQRIGQSKEDAVDYAVVGCYEPCGREEVPCSCNGVVNVPKALELALHDGCDGLSGQRIGPGSSGVFTTFEDLYWEFSRQLSNLCSGAIRLTNGFEKLYPRLHAGLFYSATLDTCVERGGDVYCDAAAKYNNSSICAIGLATAADALAAIRKLVYEEQKMTLAELVEILDRNWEGEEVLRGIVRNKCPKFGNGNQTVDALAVRIMNELSQNINNQPNARGGVYRLGILSIDWRVTWGEKTAASADGRCHGESLSQNASAAFGADREGVTAHILSVTELDAANGINGTVLDLDLHISAVRGEKGIQAMLATLDTFLKRGGHSVHYNVLNTDTLEDAQKNPEKYPNLQVRLCGWNERFCELSKEAQDEFIWRSKHQAQ